MAKHDDMMILSVELRRKHFRSAYMTELGRLHALNPGLYRWNIQEIANITDRAMSEILAKRAPIGRAYDATMKFFGLKSQKALFNFMGV